MVSGCATPSLESMTPQPPRLTTATQTHLDLINLPRSKGKIVAAVYGFRDQTGQYKPSSENSFSTAVTQGATSMLVKALNDSDWFIPVEREGLQNLLTERKIIRAVEPQEGGQKAAAPTVPSLLSASILLEGGIIAYESNVQTGGIGARHLGVGINTQYRTDQVTINLRAVDVRSGRILNSISVTKTVYSYQLAANVFRFIAFKDLLEMDTGYTTNEPAQLCVLEAIEAAVIHLVAEGVQDNNWGLYNADDINAPVLQKYIEEQRRQKPAGKIAANDTTRH
ncbi:MAG: CsgG/HfaB family protein [Pseudomonadota bacterium]